MSQAQTATNGGKAKKVAPRRRPEPDYHFDVEAFPAPEKPKRQGPIYFPFPEMNVGRSFTTRRTYGTLMLAIKRYREGIPIGPTHMEEEFKVVKLEGGGCRCWRVK